MGRGAKASAFGANGIKLLFLPKGHLDAAIEIAERLSSYWFLPSDFFAAKAFDPVRERLPPQEDR